MVARRSIQDLPDDELITLCKARDEDAFATLLERYKSRVFTLAYRMLGQREEAEDVAQEAFIHVYRAIDSFRVGDKFSSWIYRITSNLCIDHLRRRKHREISMDAPVDPEGEIKREYPDKARGPEGQVIDKEFKTALEKAILSLSPAYRSVVVLRHVHNLAYEEIARTLDLPLGTVKTRLFRAREILKRKVTAMGMLGVEPGKGV
jgi:RNA polymerase sigma-70 factor, ECF subfamily